jgi:hypothetical protein
MTIKTAGLPRWAWMALIAGGLGVGLYMHSRNSEAEAVEEGEGYEEEPSAPQNSLQSYEGTEAAGSLQGLGLAGPAATSTIPVENPTVPEGVTGTIEGQTDTISAQGETIQGLANGVLEENVATTQLASALAERPANTEIIREQLAGHAPKRATNHKPPNKLPAKPRRVPAHKAPKKAKAKKHKGIKKHH